MGIKKILGKLLIIIPFNLPWNWSTDYTNQTAFELAKRGNVVVCYMWAEKYSFKEYLKKRKFPIFIKRYSKNIYLFYPTLIIPFRRFKHVEGLNEKISMLLLKIFVEILTISTKAYKRILWIFDPKLYPLTQHFNNKYYLIYDCVDYYLSTYRSESQRKMLIKNEKRLVKKADQVCANSSVLQKHLRKIVANVSLVPQGFRIENFKNANKAKTDNIKKKDRPLIGYLGAVNHRIDYRLLYNLASKNPDWDFVVWGPILEEDLVSVDKKKYRSKLFKLPNIITGQSTKDKVPGIIKQFNIGMIPYDSKMDFNKYCYPMKLFEYFYLGKPVISTEIEELHRFKNLVKISDDYREWQDIIKKLLIQKWPNKYKLEQMRLCRENSWESKISIILESVSEDMQISH